MISSYTPEYLYSRIGKLLPPVVDFKITKTRIAWWQLGSEYGQNAGSFVWRMDLVPGSSQQYMTQLECTLLEGVVMVSPVVKAGDEKGLLIELELDFDLKSVPDFVINWLMGGVTENFIQEVTKQLITEVSG